jgi:hypothetical protein
MGTIDDSIKLIRNNDNIPTAKSEITNIVNNLLNIIC